MDFNFALFLAQSYDILRFCRILTILPRHFVPFVLHWKGQKKKHVFSATRRWVEDKRSFIFWVRISFKIRASLKAQQEISCGSQRCLAITGWKMKTQACGGWSESLFESSIWSTKSFIPLSDGATCVASSGLTAVRFMTFERHFPWDLQEWTEVNKTMHNN